ncbi:hypothetical protein SV7mr_18910 [Stieleria bergensis]|uniref:Uncharacterized protein n=1 Tax=Stieleria bergensis TaxID=2528025 RepID=A0A517STC7_9BACT|nr:hypothetical protein SV7mr_18910 [Planctomycetes bacterium SV_7m_r]
MAPTKADSKRPTRYKPSPADVVQRDVVLPLLVFCLDFHEFPCVLRSDDHVGARGVLL